MFIGVVKVEYVTAGTDGTSTTGGVGVTTVLEATHPLL
tara:strand:- start:2346 stop:2459 length:114 start_codon:yes stop_codon:yes gene_type:complete